MRNSTYTSMLKSLKILAKEKVLWMDCTALRNGGEV